MRGVGRRRDRLRPRHVALGAIGHDRGEFLGRSEGRVAVTAHERRRQDEMHVVGEVALRIEQARAALAELRFVRRGGAEIGVEALAPAADAVPDVARHVHEVAGAGHQALEPGRVRRGALGSVRRLDGVDVEMDRAGVIGIGGERTVLPVAEHPFDEGDHPLRRAFRRAPAVAPVIPRAEVHQGVGREQRHVGVLGEARLHGFHGGRIGPVERRPVGLRVGRIAARQGLDQRRADVVRAGDEPARFVQDGHRARVGVGLDRIVDVRSEHPGLAPEAQGAGRIERLRGPEGPGRLGVIEGPREPVGLIEIRLRVRLGRSGDGPGQLAEIVGKGRLLFGARRGRPARQITRIGPEFVALGRRRQRLRLSLRHHAAMAGMLSTHGQAVQKAHPRAVVSAERTRADWMSCREQQGRRCRGAEENDALRRTRMSKRRKDHCASPTRGLVKARCWHRRDERKHRGLGGRTAHRRKS